MPVVTLLLGMLIELLRFTLYVALLFIALPHVTICWTFIPHVVVGIYLLLLLIAVVGAVVGRPVEPRCFVVCCCDLFVGVGGALLLDVVVALLPLAVGRTLFIYTAPLT